jgi:hypothetical protein
MWGRGTDFHICRQLFLLTSPIVEGIVAGSNQTGKVCPPPFLFPAREVRVIVQGIELTKCNFGGDISPYCTSSLKKRLTIVAQTQNSFYIQYISLWVPHSIGGIKVD